MSHCVLLEVNVLLDTLSSTACATIINYFGDYYSTKHTLHIDFCIGLKCIIIKDYALFLIRLIISGL